MTTRAQCAALLILAIAGSAHAVDSKVFHESPLRPAQAAEGGWLKLAWDQDAYEGLKMQTHPAVEAFPLAPDLSVQLNLQRFEILTPDARIVAVDGNGERELPRPDALHFRGTVAGEDESRVYLTVSPLGSNGWIVIGDRKFIIATPPPHEGRPTVVYEDGTLPAGTIPINPWTCGNDELPFGGAIPNLGAEFNAAPASPSSGMDNNPCRVVTIAIDTDFEYTNVVFDGDEVASAAYATTLLSAVSEIYRRDVDIGLEVSYVRVWASNVDPYEGSSVGDRLWEVRDEWNENMTEIDRNLVHMLTGLRLGTGGVAFLGVLCDLPMAYGVSGHLRGGFPYPLINNSFQNWDVIVVAHEIGHNFNSRHTHEVTPRIDGCGVGNCGGANQGTIMSYCHLCPGGDSNIRLEFHPRILNEEIFPYLNSVTCSILRTPVSILTHPAGQSGLVGTNIQLSVQADGSGPLIYRWRRNGVLLTDGGGVSGTSTHTLTISNLQPSHAGRYTVEVVNACSDQLSQPADVGVVQPCYANCDGSTAEPILNILDFLCFLQHFSYATTLSVEQQIGNYANCDRSTTEPVLTVNDFVCFINKFNAGCN